MSEGAPRQLALISPAHVALQNTSSTSYRLHTCTNLAVRMWKTGGELGPVPHSTHAFRSRISKWNHSCEASFNSGSSGDMARHQGCCWPWILSHAGGQAQNMRTWNGHLSWGSAWRASTSAFCSQSLGNKFMKWKPSCFFSFHVVGRISSCWSLHISSKSILVRLLTYTLLCHLFQVYFKYLYNLCKFKKKKVKNIHSVYYCAHQVHVLNNNLF